MRHPAGQLGWRIPLFGRRREVRASGGRAQGSSTCHTGAPVTAVDDYLEATADRTPRAVLEHFAGLNLERGDELDLALLQIALATLGLLVSIDDRVAGLEGKFAEYEPLIEMVKARAERGTFRTKFGGKT